MAVRVFASARSLKLAEAAEASADCPLFRAVLFAEGFLVAVFFAAVLAAAFAAVVFFVEAATLVLALVLALTFALAAVPAGSLVFVCSVMMSISLG